MPRSNKNRWKIAKQRFVNGPLKVAPAKKELSLEEKIEFAKTRKEEAENFLTSLYNTTNKPGEIGNPTSQTSDNTQLRVDYANQRKKEVPTEATTVKVEPQIKNNLPKSIFGLTEDDLRFVYTFLYGKKYFNNLGLEQQTMQELREGSLTEDDAVERKNMYKIIKRVGPTTKAFIGKDDGGKTFDDATIVSIPPFSELPDNTATNTIKFWSSLKVDDTKHMKALGIAAKIKSTRVDSGTQSAVLKLKSGRNFDDFKKIIDEFRPK